jgi:hypothetical protein
MTYLMTTNTTGDLATFRAICERVDPHTTGLVARYAGMNEHGLAITSIWETKAACDRFTTELLFPAFEAVLGAISAPDGRGVFVNFETVDEFSPERAS